MKTPLCFFYDNNNNKDFIQECKTISTKLISLADNGASTVSATIRRSSIKNFEWKHDHRPVECLFQCLLHAFIISTLKLYWYWQMIFKLNKCALTP